MKTDWRLDKTKITDIIAESLREVADFPQGADISGYSFERWQDFHKVVFLTSLKKRILSQKYVNAEGKPFYYDVRLEADLFGQWKTIKDCVNYVYEEQSIAVKEDPIVYN